MSKNQTSNDKSMSNESVEKMDSTENSIIPQSSSTVARTEPQQQNRNSILTNLRKVEFNRDSKQAYSYTVYFDPYIPDDNHVLKNLFYETITRKHHLEDLIGENFIYGNKVFGKKLHEDDQVYKTTNFKTGEEYTVTVRYEREIKDDVNLINHIHKKQLQNDGFSKKKNQNKKQDQFVERNTGANYTCVDHVNIKQLNGFSTHLSQRGGAFYALTNPCGRFVHSKSLYEVIQELDSRAVFDLRFKQGNPENSLELVQVSYDHEINKTYKILHIINDVDMNEIDPVQRFKGCRFVDERPEEETDNQVVQVEDEKYQDWKFKSSMYKNDFEHLVVRKEKETGTYSQVQHQINHQHDIINDDRISFREYFVQNQGQHLKHDRQSVVICKSKDNEFYIKPAEVCQINHLPQAVNNNREFKRLQFNQTKQQFDSEIRMIDGLVNHINANPDNEELVKDLRVSDRVVAIEEYFTLDPPTLQAHNQPISLENNVKFFNTQIREFQSRRRVNNVCILFSNKMKPQIQTFKHKFLQCQKQKGCNFGYIEHLFIDHNYNKNWELLIDQLTRDYEVIILLLPKFLSQLYQKFKIFHIFNERTVVQVIRETTVTYLFCDQEGCKNYAKYGQKQAQFCKQHHQPNMKFQEDSDENKLHSIVNNVVQEISRKLLNQAPWVVQFKHKEENILPGEYAGAAMFMGVDVCHSINNHKKPSVFVMSSSLDPELKDWACEHLVLDKYHREFITKECYMQLFERCLVKWFQTNNKQPKLVVIQRDGIGDAEEKQAEFEIDWVKELAKKQGGFKVVQIAVNKNNLLRLSKPMAPGSILNEEGIAQRSNHFYIFTTLGRKSKNIIPKQCKILLNELEQQGLTAQDIWRITFYLCQCQYSQAGVISIPVPIKLADKRAYMVYNFRFEDCKDFYDKWYKQHLDYWGFKEITLE